MRICVFWDVKNVSSAGMGPYPFWGCTMASFWKRLVDTQKVITSPWNQCIPSKLHEPLNQEYGVIPEDCNFELPSKSFSSQQISPGPVPRTEPVSSRFSLQHLLSLSVRYNASFYVVHTTFGVGRSKRPSRLPHHVEACGLGWIYLPCPLQSVCHRHAITLAPRRVDPLHGRQGNHNHVPQAEASRQLLGVISQRPSTVIEQMENDH